MQPADLLKKKLASIDGKDYGAYQSLLGEYDFRDFSLLIQQIPKDPYAPPHTGIYRVRVRRADPAIIHQTLDIRIREIAFRDLIARQFYRESLRHSGGRRGTGYSGLITISQPGQAILERSSVVIDKKAIEVRCFLGLPASGRKISARVAVTMLFEELPEIVRSSLYRDSIAPADLQKHLAVAEDAVYLRNKLADLGIIAFIADHSNLPRQSGTSDQPLSPESAVPFISPDQLKLAVTLPNAGTITGMGIPPGVTLIAGGGYHGKSTLLQAVAAGIYNHVPGDGREYCVSLDQTVKIRSYSGRYITQTDISPFIRNLPLQKDTTAFSTVNASGSTSQAAGIIEAIEVGARVLLMDEDTCATNFMIRDAKMQQLVQKKDEPITAFIDKVRPLFTEKGVSTILVLGGAGDYFDVADRVIQMINYHPVEVTAKAWDITRRFPAGRSPEDAAYPFGFPDRIPLGDSIDPRNQYGKKGIYTSEVHRLNFGSQVIDLTDLEQLIELSQTKALGFAINYARKYMDGKALLKEVIERVGQDIDQKGLDVLSGKISGNFARFRSLELAFALNRLRSFQVKQRKNNKK